MNKYMKKTFPSRTTIKNLICAFEPTGSVLYKTILKKKTRDKRNTAKNHLKNVIAEMPNLSIRKATSVVGMSHTLVFTILHNDLHLKPYKIHQ